MISFFVLRYSRLLKKSISFSAEKQTNHYVFRQKKAVVNLQAVTGMDPKVSRYRTLQRQQLRSTLRSPGTLAARVGLHLLTGLLMGVLLAQENP